jgi:hypothetical protein
VARLNIYAANKGRRYGRGMWQHVLDKRSAYELLVRKSENDRQIRCMYSDGNIMIN